MNLDPHEWVTIKMVKRNEIRILRSWIWADHDCWGVIISTQKIHHWDRCKLTGLLLSSESVNSGGYGRSRNYAIAGRVITSWVYIFIWLHPPTEHWGCFLFCTGASPKSVVNIIGPSVDFGEAPGGRSAWRTSRSTRYWYSNLILILKRCKKSYQQDIQTLLRLGN
jgi:hypothetical protein